MAARSAPRARRATSGGSHSPSEAVEWQCRSMCGVIDLGGGPRGLRLAEELDQLALGELGESTIGRAGAERRVVRDAAAALRPGPLLEDETELIAAIDRHATGGIHLPALALYCDRSAGHTLTSDHRSHASGAYVANAWSRFSSLISSGKREAWARCDISVGLSENSMNRRGSLALRYSQIRCPRASANCLSSRSVFTYSVSFCVGTRTRAAVKTLGILTPLPRETPARAASHRPGTCRRRRRRRRDDRTTS